MASTIGDSYARLVAGSVARSILVGRYTLFAEFASGGMGTIHFARMAEAGRVRAVAIKRLHPHLRNDEEFAVMLLDEARLAMSVRHRNVVEVIDVVSTRDELLLVMEYVSGLSLHQLTATKERVPLEVAVAIIVDALHGLHAAHNAVAPNGRPLGLVHRDVSPQNLIVSSEGVTKLTDFGVAKAVGRLRSTRDGGIKGKIAYMSPEQVSGAAVDARADVYSSAVVLWEMIVGRPMFDADSDVALFGKAMRGPTERLTEAAPGIPPALDAAVWRALSRDPRRRYPDALAFAEALSSAAAPANPRAVATWVNQRGRRQLEARERIVKDIVRGLDAPTLTDEVGLSRESGEARDPTSPVGVEPDLASIGEPRGLGVGVDWEVAKSVPAMTSPAPAQVVGTSRRARLTALGIVALLTVVLSVLFLRNPNALSATNAPATPNVDFSSSSVSPANVMPLASVSPTSTPEPELPSVHPTPAAPTGTTGGTTTSRTTPAVALPKRTATPAVRRHDKEPKEPAKNDCNPPFSVDEQGDKHFKSWCLR